LPLRRLRLILGLRRFVSGRRAETRSFRRKRELSQTRFELKSRTLIRFSDCQGDEKMDPQVLAALMAKLQGQQGGGMPAMPGAAPPAMPPPAMSPVGAVGGASPPGLAAAPAPQGPPPTNAPLPQRRGDSGAGLYNREPTREMQTGAGMPRPRQALPQIPRNALGALLMPQGPLGASMQPPSNPGISSVLGQFLRPQS
jgi:hypothetical protein